MAIHSPTPSAIPGFALLLALLLSSSAEAREIEGVAFADAVQIEETRVPLQGVGLLRYRVFFDAYVAALYAPDSPAQRDPLQADSRRLEIEYFWPLRAEQFAGATIDGISANVTEAEMTSLLPVIQRFNSFYEDIEPGDRYALTFGAGQTELSKNGRPLGRVEGTEFGRAIFAIWLGTHPLSEGLKKDLLGGATR